MTWKEIKSAVEQAGVRESDDIVEIQCELNDGSKTLHPVRLGKYLRLAENLSEHAQEVERNSTGC